MFLVWLVLSCFTIAHAEDKAANEDKPQTAAVTETRDSVKAAASEEDEDKPQTTVIDSIASVKAVSQSLKNRFDSVIEALQKSQNYSKEAAELELNKVSELANEAVSLFDEDSKIWSYTTQLIDTYGANARYAEGKVEQGQIGSPFTKQWRKIAELWHEKKTEMKKIQGELRVLRKKNRALLDELPSRREILAQYFQLDMAEQAIAGLNYFVKDMQSMQDALTKVIGGLEKVSPGKAPQ